MDARKRGRQLGRIVEARDDDSDLGHDVKGRAPKAYHVGNGQAKDIGRSRPSP